MARSACCRSEISRETDIMTSKFLLAVALVGVVGLNSIDARAGSNTVVNSASAPAPSGIVYTANEKDGTISAVDLATGRVDNVAIPIMPHNVQIAVDGRLLYAVGMGMTMPGTSGMANHGKAGGRLVILDSLNMMRGPVEEIAVGPHPAHVVMSLDGKLAFVTDSKKNLVQVIDLAGKRIIRTIATGLY